MDIFHVFRMDRDLHLLAASTLRNAEIDVGTMPTSQNLQSELLSFLLGFEGKTLCEQMAGRRE